MVGGVCWVSGPVRVVQRLRVTPDGPLRVLHHTAAALYLATPSGCVGVVTPAAAQVPCALRIVPGVSAPEVLPVGGPGPYVERGTLYLAGNPLLVGRFVDVRAPRIDLGRVSRQAASPANAEEPHPQPAAIGLAAVASLGPLPPVLDRATLLALVGRGDGLTPLGDDVVAGWLAVLAAADRLDEALAAEVRAVLPRTTLLSAALLDCALHGEALPQFAAYVAAVGTPAEAAAVVALRAVGHTSGTGLWWGARHALATLTREQVAA